MDYFKEFRDLVGRAIQFNWLDGDIATADSMITYIKLLINNELSSTNYLSDEDYGLWMQAIAIDSCTHGLQGNIDKDLQKS
jgi:hypothetical protein